MRSAPVLVYGLLLALPLGCGISVNPPGTIDLPATKAGSLALIHAAPGGAKLDLALTPAGGKGNPTTLAMREYGTATSYMELPAGTYNAELRLSGGQDALAKGEVRIEPERRSVLVAIGQPGSLALLGMPAGAPAADGVRLRLLHAVPGAPAVSLAKKSASEPELLQIAYGVAYDHLTLPETDLAAGAELALRPANKTVPLAYAKLAGALPKGAVVTAIATGELSPTGQSPLALWLFDEQMAQLSKLDLSINKEAKTDLLVVHASAGAPAVDVSVAGTTAAVKALRFRGASAALQVPAGELSVEVRPENMPMANPLVSLKGRFLPLTSWLLVVQGSPAAMDDKKLRVAVYPRLSGGMDGAALLRLLHASPDAPAVDLLADKTRLFGNVGYGQVAKELDRKVDDDLRKLLTTTGLTVWPTGGMKGLYTVIFPMNAVDALLGQATTLIAAGSTKAAGMAPDRFTVFGVVESKAQDTTPAQVIELQVSPIP